MDENKIIQALESKGYSVGSNSIGNVKSFQKLSSDMLAIISDLMMQYKIADDIGFHKQIELSADEKSKFPFTISEPFTYNIPDAVVRRQAISNQLFPTNKYPAITNSSEFVEKLNQMFKLYDYWFFSNLIYYGLNKGKGSVVFEISNRMTSTGGTCSRKGICTYLIKLSANRLNKLTPGNLPPINGIVPKDRIEGLQLIFEHELIHMVLSLFINNIIGHNDLYRTIVFNLFGHTKVVHKISDTKLGKFTKKDFNIGDAIHFYNKKKENVRGKIIKLNPKRARIDTDRGAIYDVPYEMLKK